MHTDVVYRHQPHDPFNSSPTTNAYIPSDSLLTYHDRTRDYKGSLRRQKTAHSNHSPQTTGDRLPTSSSSYHTRSYIAENMLRRKTPNGTLAAGFDGRPVEWASRRPPNKQFLMQASNPAEEEAVCQPQARYKTYHDQANLPWIADQPTRYRYDHHRMGRLHQNRPSPDGNWQSRVESKSNPVPVPGLDSVLYQGSPSHQPSFYASGQQFPMVMQPMWPPCVGITSLNHPGPYGPYWPNGAFVPYRPAPVRDPRFPTDLDEFSPRDTMQDRTQDPRYIPSISHNLPPLSEAAASSLSMSCFSTMIPADHNASRIQEPTQPLPNQRYGSMGTYRSNPTSPETSLQRISDARPFSVPSPDDVSLQCANPSDLNSSNVQYKERALIWAHRVYMSLLSFKQQARRTGSNAQYSNHRYPQEQQVLPQLPRGKFSKLLPDSPCQSGDRLNPYQFTPVCYQGTDATLTASQPLPDTDMHSHAAWKLTNTRPTYGSATLSGKQINQEFSPVTAAVNAIQLLSELSQNSDWKWTDGMLLGGCLAYGLGEYSKALKWYSKVLSCDQK